jgi:hypothetical protein
MEHFIRSKEEYVARRTRVHSSLQWIQEGDEPSKFYFDSLKNNNNNISEQLLGH